MHVYRIKGETTGEVLGEAFSCGISNYDLANLHYRRVRCFLLAKRYLENGRKVITFTVYIDIDIFKLELLRSNQRVHFSSYRRTSLDLFFLIQTRNDVIARLAISRILFLSLSLLAPLLPLPIPLRLSTCFHLPLSLSLHFSSSSVDIYTV